MERIWTGRLIPRQEPPGSSRISIEVPVPAIWDEVANLNGGGGVVSSMSITAFGIDLLDT